MWREREREREPGVALAELFVLSVDGNPNNRKLDSRVVVGVISMSVYDLYSIHR